MGHKHNKTEYKETTSITLYPSTKEKAKRLGLNLSKMLEAAISALPDVDEQQNSRQSDQD